MKKIAEIGIISLEIWIFLLVVFVQDLSFQLPSQMVPFFPLGHFWVFIQQLLHIKLLRHFLVWLQSCSCKGGLSISYAQKFSWKDLHTFKYTLLSLPYKPCLKMQLLISTLLYLTFSFTSILKRFLSVSWMHLLLSFLLH